MLDDVSETVMVSVNVIFTFRDTPEVWAALAAYPTKDDDDEAGNENSQIVFELEVEMGKGLTPEEQMEAVWPTICSLRRTIPVDHEMLEHSNCLPRLTVSGDLACRSPPSPNAKQAKTGCFETQSKMEDQMNLGSQPVTHAMSVDIIVTYTEKRHVYAKLENAEMLLNKSQQQVGLYQAHFEIITQVTAEMTYDNVMANVRDAVFAVSEQTLGTDRREIIKISTAADWVVWEQLTGRNSEADDAESAICRNGKFLF